MLRVPLETADELPYALSTLRFMYTDSLDVTTMDALLRVRRLAAYLQVDGCTEACDSAIASLLSARPPEAGPSALQGPLAGVLALYSQRHLLPSPPDEEGTVLKLLDICRQQLVQHSGAVGGVAGPLVQGGPSLGELLAWAFRDAPSLLSDPATRKQMEDLPTTAMEALLRCDAFATDDEASVLLMVAYWLVAAYKKSHFVTAILTGVCKLVRLSQLNSTFLHVVLPSPLAWFPINPEEHRFLCDYVAAPAVQRSRMAASAVGLYDCSCAWYAAPARPRLPPQSVRLYEWSIPGKDLEAALANGGLANGKFANGAERVMSYGLEWYPSVGFDKERDAATAYLFCSWPSVLGPANPDKIVALVQPGPVALRVDKGRNDDAGGRADEPAWSLAFGPDMYVRVGKGRGDGDALPLQVARPGAAQTGAAASVAVGSSSGGSGARGPTALSAWEPHLRDGCMRGSLRWSW